eukprot:TRINITY_DN6965_c0_g1_i3.p1 TRINITY_DN6965_c0_g1~~TRINITY_DN6965_c0_g1_i3.p1  ORF type:complete len:494 (+),score=132.63 TRINITY_DN6965_c0_g1_i3:97-1482(+)
MPGRGVATAGRGAAAAGGRGAEPRSGGRGASGAGLTVGRGRGQALDSAPGRGRPPLGQQRAPKRRRMDTGAAPVPAAAAAAAGPQHVALVKGPAPPPRGAAAGKSLPEEQRLADVEAELRGVLCDAARAREVLAANQRAKLAALQRKPLLELLCSGSMVQLTKEQLGAIAAAVAAREAEWAEEDEGLTEEEVSAQRSVRTKELETIRTRMREQFAAERSRMLEEVREQRLQELEALEARRREQRAEEDAQQWTAAGELAARRCEAEQLRRLVEQAEKAAEAQAAERAARAQAVAKLAALEKRCLDAAARRQQELGALGAEAAAAQQKQAQQKGSVGAGLGRQLRESLAKEQQVLAALKRELSLASTAASQARRAAPSACQGPARTAPAGGAGGTDGGGYRVGDKVDCLYGAQWHPATIRRVYGDKCDVDWEAEASYSQGLVLSSEVRRRVGPDKGRTGWAR